VLGNALGTDYDKSTDCNGRSGRKFAKRGDEMYKELGCKTPQDPGSWDEVK
jgi:hypothetical protein